MKRATSLVDILMRMDKLRKRITKVGGSGKYPYLEKVGHDHPGKAQSHAAAPFIKREKNALRRGETAYVSWGKGTKRPLRFSKSGDPNTREAYSTHFLRPKDRRITTKLNGRAPFFIEPFCLSNHSKMNPCLNVDSIF